MTDKGYDSQANRAAALARGINPVIPRRENSKQRGRFFPKRLYKLRARIEQTIGKLKRFNRLRKIGGLEGPDGTLRPVMWGLSADFADFGCVGGRKP
jgi:hypothetical protein